MFGVLDQTVAVESLRLLLLANTIKFQIKNESVIVREVPQGSIKHQQMRHGRLRGHAHICFRHMFS